LLGFANDDDSETLAIRSRDLASLESSIFGLGGLAQSDAVELDSLGAAIFTNDLRDLGDFLNGQLVCRQC